MTGRAVGAAEGTGVLTPTDDGRGETIRMCYNKERGCVVL